MSPDAQTTKPEQISEQTIDSLNAEFGITNVLRFVERGELIVAEITTPQVQAAVALQGAHLITWQPAGGAPGLFLSERSAFARGKAIRGGVPVIWPWFGGRTDAVNPVPAGAPPSPSHGFARTSSWRLQFAALSGDTVHLSLLLEPTAESRVWGFDGFALAYHLVIGQELRMGLSVANTGTSGLRFEAALHSYFAVGSVEQATLHGLEATEFLDKTDSGRRKRQADSPLQLTGSTDRVYLGTEAACRIDDEGLGRSIHIVKRNSANTVVWNPWTELTAGLADMEPEGWRGMLCVETANVGETAIHLAPGERFAMGAQVSITQAGAAPPKPRWGEEREAPGGSIKP